MQPKGSDGDVSMGPSFGDDLDEGCSPNYLDEVSGKPVDKAGMTFSMPRGNSTFALTSKRIQANPGDNAANASSDIKKVVPKRVLPNVVGSNRNISIGSLRLLNINKQTSIESMDQ